MRCGINAIHSPHVRCRPMQPARLSNACMDQPIWTTNFSYTSESASHHLRSMSFSLPLPQAGHLKTFFLIACILCLIRFFLIIVHRSAFCLVLATTLFALGASAASTWQPAVRNDAVNQIVARDVGSGVVTKRDDDEIVARNRWGGLTRRDTGEILTRGNRCGGITRRDDDEILARDRFRGITRRDEDEILTRGNRFGTVTRRDDDEIPARDRFGGLTRGEDDKILARDDWWGGITKRNDATKGVGDLSARVERTWEDLPVA